MTAKVETSVEEGVVRVYVSGELRLDTVAVVHRSVNLSSFGNKCVDIELGGITDADSSGVALCVEWLSQARSNHTSLKFTNVPDVLTRIARINKLDDIYRVDTDSIPGTE